MLRLNFPGAKWMRNVCGVALVIVQCCSLGAGARGADLLRWKLKAGDKLRVVSEQTIDASTKYSGKATESKTSVRVQATWLVQSASDGKIVIEQKLDKVSATIEPGQGEKVEYDSAVEGRATGIARQLQDAIKPLIGVAIGVTMTDRGEVTDVSLPAALEKTLTADADTAKAIQPIKNLLSQTIVLLPEKEASVGDEWSADTDAASSVGAIARHTVYRLTDAGDAEANKPAKIELTSQIKLADAQTKFKVTQQEHSGTASFSLGKAVVTDAEQTLLLKGESPYREATIETEVRTVLRTTVEVAE